MKYVFKRTAGKSGFVGTWETTSEPMSVFVLEVRPYEGDGLSFVMPSGVTSSVKFDGKDYPVEGPNVLQGSVSSGRRVNERSLQLTDKVSGKTRGTAQMEVSPDLKTLTRTAYPAGKSKPNIFVFDRE